MIILHRFCLVSLENRSRQIGEALLEGDHTALLPDERVAQMYANHSRNLGEPILRADLVLRVVAEAWGYLPTLVQYRDEQRAGVKVGVTKRQEGYEPKDGPWFDEAAGWFNAGYTRERDGFTWTRADPPEDEAASEPKEDPGPFFGSSDHTSHEHWTYGWPYGYATGETFNMRFTYTTES